MKIDPRNIKEFVKRFAVAPGSKINLKKDFDPGDTAGYEKPEKASAFLDEGVEFLADYQEKLYAENSALCSSSSRRSTRRARTARSSTL